MRIRTIISQYRRDFTATLECEHCGKTAVLRGGYDDDNYHKNVIPSFKCDHCGEKSPDSYRPLQTKYPSTTVV